MKHSKRLLIGASAFIIAMNINAENLPGRARNLNMFRHNKHMWAQLSAMHNDSGNVLRDLACNCDNSDFELTAQLTGKPFAILNKLGTFETLQDLETFFNNPMANAAATAYLQKLEVQAANNTKAFAKDNLKEMLFSVDQDGKTVFDILQEKQNSGKAGCLLLKEVAEVIKQDIAYAEKREQEKKEIEELVNQISG